MELDERLLGTGLLKVWVRLGRSGGSGHRAGLEVGC
jgi:hypothetical protein